MREDNPGNDITAVAFVLFALLQTSVPYFRLSETANRTQRFDQSYLNIETEYGI